MNTISDLVRKKALSILFSAGVPVDEDLMDKVSRTARRTRSGCAPEEIRDSAYDVLDIVSFPVDRETGILNHYPEYMTGGHPGDLAEEADRANAGHLVLLTREWSIVPAGETMIISGERDSGRYFAGRGGHYWGMDRETGLDDRFVSLTNGGPRALQPVSLAGLTPTGRIAPVSFWRFPGLPAAHTGVHYTRLMPVWEWDGSFLDA